MFRTNDISNLNEKSIKKDISIDNSFNVYDHVYDHISQVPDQYEQPNNSKRKPHLSSFVTNYPTSSKHFSKKYIPKFNGNLS